MDKLTKTPRRNRPIARWVALALTVIFLVSQILFYFTKEQTRGTPTPTYHDVAYGDTHESQKLDVYLADSDQPQPAMIFIHGGGWMVGSKNAIPDWLIKAVRQGWLSVVSVEYRFIGVAPHPAQVNDCVRAVQFVRQHAAAWNIDPDRIGITGGSAGGHLSLWVALHDDLAKPESKTPLARQSSRMRCVLSFAGPTDWTLLDKVEHRQPPFWLLLDYEPGTPTSEMDAKMIADVSPITFASQDDPPVMLIHGDQDDVVPIEHARNLTERLKAAGGTVELVVVEGGGHGEGLITDHEEKIIAAFVRNQLHVPEKR